MKRIEITIAIDGTTKVETKGFDGTSCRDASRLIEASLGKTQSETLTSDFYQTTSQTQRETEST